MKKINEARKKVKQYLTDTQTILSLLDQLKEIHGIKGKWVFITEGRNE
jgi:hypothetical protein